MNAANIGPQLKQGNRFRLLPGKRRAVNLSNVFFRFAITSLALALLFLGCLVERAMVSQNSVMLDQRRSDLIRLDQEYQSLLIDNACLKSPERIQKTAIERLGMIVPDHINYIQLPVGYDSGKKLREQEQLPFPIALADDFWLNKVFKSTNVLIRKPLTPTTTAEATTGDR